MKGYTPTAEFHDQSKWDPEQLKLKGILEEDLYASAHGVLSELETLFKDDHYEIKDAHLNVLHTLSSTGKL